MCTDFEATKVFRTTQILKSLIYWLESPYLDVLKKNISEQNDGISSEILLSFRTEAVEDRNVIFNQIQGS